MDHLEDESFKKLPAMLSLNLSHNQLITLEVEVLETLENLQRIDLKR
jgi:Leucine-rich repeat (LRR) protein